MSTATRRRRLPRRGKILFEAAVEGLVQLVDELRTWPIEERRDMHRGPVQAERR